MAILTDDVLEGIRSRAPGYDRDNAFFAEDLAVLREAGYLTALVPTEFGSAGLSLQQLVHEHSRLAAAAPATALGIGMHLVWTGVARFLNAQGDHSLDFVLEEAAAGELFAFAISEPGNDLMLFGSTTEATPLDTGGYRFTGTKIFTSLSPAWTRLGTFGLDTVSADAPKLVHAVVERTSSGITVANDWNTIGMRASQSHSTRLDGVAADPARVFRRLDPGPSADPLIFAIFANFEVLIATVYAGIADRALQLAVESATSRTSARTGLARSQDPAVRARIADAALAVDRLRPHLDRIAADVDSAVAGRPAADRPAADHPAAEHLLADHPAAVVDHGDQWFRLLVGVKVAAVRTARQVVDQAVAVAGGASFFAGSEIGRLSRDVMAGPFHPSNDDSASATIATALLGPVL